MYHASYEVFHEFTSGVLMLFVDDGYLPQYLPQMRNSGDLSAQALMESKLTRVAHVEYSHDWRSELGCKKTKDRDITATLSPLRSWSMKPSWTSTDRFGHYEKKKWLTRRFVEYLNCLPHCWVGSSIGELYLCFVVSHLSHPENGWHIVLLFLHSNDSPGNSASSLLLFGDNWRYCRAYAWPRYLPSAVTGFWFVTELPSCQHPWAIFGLQQFLSMQKPREMLHKELLGRMVMPKMASPTSLCDAETTRSL